MTEQMHPVLAVEASRLVPDPRCKMGNCGGKKGYYGIGVNSKTKEPYLLLCCGRPGPTEHTRVMQAFREIPRQVDDIIGGHASLLIRYTFFGGLAYFFGYVIPTVKWATWLWGKIRREKAGTKKVEEGG